MLIFDICQQFIILVNNNNINICVIIKNVMCITGDINLNMFRFGKYTNVLQYLTVEKFNYVICIHRKYRRKNQNILRCAMC